MGALQNRCSAAGRMRNASTIAFDTPVVGGRLPNGLRRHLLGHFEAGKYTFRSHAPDVEVAEQTITLTANRPDHDLGTIDLKASAIGKLKGKAPPAWVIADARGVKAGVKLADYKGKWVYIKFWGHW